VARSNGYRILCLWCFDELLERELPGVKATFTILEILGLQHMEVETGEGLQDNESNPDRTTVVRNPKPREEGDER